MSSTLALRFFIIAVVVGNSGVQAQVQNQSHTSYVMKLDLWGNAIYQTVELDQHGSHISGTIDRDPFIGTRSADEYNFVATAADKSTYSYRAKLSNKGWVGTADFPDSNHPGRRMTHAFTANIIPARPAGSARTYRYTPTTYSNEFSAQRTPVMTIWPGDSVQTKTIDSGGVDENGVTVALYGNPQTGPFYIAGADAGDVLAVHIKSLRLNRDYADSLDMIVHKAQSARLATKASELGRPVRWKLDLKNGLASPENAQGNLKNLSIPVKPMLGGLAVAPGAGMPPISTGDTGSFGGNMDFNEVVAQGLIDITRVPIETDSRMFKSQQGPPALNRRQNF